jgi:hypothetical protein
MSEVTVEQFENHLDGLKETIEFRDAVQRLAKNRDFVKVITNGFMLHEASRYVQASGDPALTAVQRADALAIAQASGHLKRFLSVSIQIGNKAQDDMPELERQLDLARRGVDDDDDFGQE